MAATGIYTRISMDRVGAGLGVERQEQDCTELCRRRGWDVAETYRDNDISAYSGKPRPGYQRLLADVRAGKINAVVAWHTDRLHRSPLELEEFIEVVEATGCRVETARAGEVDLSTPSGRMVARILGATARHESEHKADRIRRKHQQLAETGAPAGGMRPFGYERDYMRVRDDEAAIIREAASRVLAGESLRSVCRDLSDRRVPTPQGGAWTPAGLKRILTGARISGRREYQRAQGGIGRITGNAKWPAIITSTESDRLRTYLTNPMRRTGNPSFRSYLLNGIARCGRCGAVLHGSQRPYGKIYVCNGTPSNPGCMRITVAAEPLDTLVTAAVLRTADGGSLAEAKGRGSDDVSDLADDLASIESKLAGLARDWAEDTITRQEWISARDALASRKAELEARLALRQRVMDIDDVPDPLHQAWPTLPIHSRRSIIRVLVDSVVIHPSERRGGRFDPRRVELCWAA
jgi:DNA invertase Pin-like site-specific DNA recombinase